MRPGRLLFFTLLFTATVFQSYTAAAQLTQVTGKTTYHFWQYLPHDSILKKNPPLLVFLHGRSLSGDDLNLVKRYGVITEIEAGRKIPAIVVAPQVPKGKGWEPDLVLEVINYVRKNYKTDTNRLYVVGMSLGGYGVLHFVGKYYYKVAAAIALCGGGNLSDACNLAKVHLWIEHGRLDKAVPFSESENLVEAIKKCDGGKKLKFTIFDNYGHGELARCFREDSFYDWLFAQRRDTIPSH